MIKKGLFKFSVNFFAFSIFSFGRYSFNSFGSFKSLNAFVPVCQKFGKAGKAVLEGQVALGNRLVVNTSGGLKARGHPIGATGVAQIVEITEQLRGSADKRQVEGAKYGLAQSVGGIGSAVTVSIMEAI